MRWNSFRVRLTLWNVAVLALVLGGFGLALCYSIQSWMSRNIDRELAERAHRVAFRGFRSPPMFRGAPGRRGGEYAPFDAEAERRAAFWRPRLLNLHGEVLGPPDARGPWDAQTVPQAIAGRERYSTIRAAGERVRVFSAPWSRGGQLVG